MSLNSERAIDVWQNFEGVISEPWLKHQVDGAETLSQLPGLVSMRQTVDGSKLGIYITSLDVQTLEHESKIVTGKREWLIDWTVLWHAENIWYPTWCCERATLTGVDITWILSTCQALNILYISNCVNESWNCKWKTYRGIQDLLRVPSCVTVYMLKKNTAVSVLLVWLKRIELVL